MKQIKRYETRQIKIGNITIGGSNKVLIQSMCNIKTENIIEVIKQINECHKLGADLMRVSVLDEADAYAIKNIVSNIKIPLIADIHFDYKLAILAIENGVSAVRLNPGNIGNDKNVQKVMELCNKKQIPIRIGINSGSLDKEIDKLDIPLSEKLVLSAEKMVKLLEKYSFYNIVISLKASNVIETIKAYELASRKFIYPLHLGITEAGPSQVGVIRSVAGLSPLLIQGIGDTIRISLSDSPQEEVKTAKRLLKDLNIINNYPTLISCPTCGRTQVDLIPLSNKILKYLEDNNIFLTVAVMGCIVNGPGEAKNADIGVAGGKGCWSIFKKGIPFKSVKEEDIYNELIKEINLIKN